MKYLERDHNLIEADYQLCNRCVMDTSDPEISFDNLGVCSHCHTYDKIIRSPIYIKKREDGSLGALVDRIKRHGVGKKYDCIIGVSGGVDSTYVAYLTKEYGLRALAVHLDNGWNSELAVSNIEKTLKKLNIDLYTYVLDWDEFRDLQLSFLKASVPDAEIPTDHAIIALLYMMAAREGVRYILTGQNVSTESAGVPAWSQGHSDWLYIRSIHQLFGNIPLHSFPHYGLLKFVYYTLLNRIKLIPILDYVNYNKKDVIQLLNDNLCWKYYGGKHHESIYTRFYRGHYLPQKFGFDKRREDLSSLIWSGQISREDALKELNTDTYDPDLQEQDKTFVIKKFNITNDGFQVIMNTLPRSFYYYPSYKKYLYKYRYLINLYHILKSS